MRPSRSTSFPYTTLFRSARDPELAGFDISAYNFSTEEVSGDYYDFLKLYDDHLGVVIADVSGKGVPAALLMAFLRASRSEEHTSELQSRQYLVCCLLLEK